MSEKYIKYTSDNFTYDKILKPKVTIGLPLSKEKYETDAEGNLTEVPDPLVNALDINWGGASVLEDTPINTTDDLLYTIDQINKNSGGDTSPIIGLMMQAIRALQAEVVKLRNSFTYGIYSYKDKQTAMSNVLGEYTVEELGAEEPLWAVDEDTLSELISVNLSAFNGFDPQDNISLDIENNALIFKGTSTWTDEDNILSQVVDPKVYVYFTATDLNITLHLIEKVEEGQDAKTLDIKLNELFNSNESGKAYNILFVLAAKVEQNKELKGQNFCWIQVGHYILDENIQQGYYNKETKQIQDAFVGFGDERYYIHSVTFNNLELSKFNFYSKYQNFANEVESTNPIYQDRYKAAHITIRSIDTYENLVDIKDQLPENELIYVENGKGTLYIKNDYKLKKIGAGGDEPGPEPQPDTMTNKELLEALRKMGIVYEHYHEDPDTQDYELDLAALDSVTFIHQASGKMFDISVDAYGKLQSVEQNKIPSVIERLGGVTNLRDIFYDITTSTRKKHVRGFVANFRAKEQNANAGAASDLKLLADRVKIAAVYAPLKDEETHGCSHAYVELENNSDKDFPLENCYLHYCKWENENYITYHLKLDGYIPAGGTYLVRGKQYANLEKDVNVFINVETYDKEWYITTDDDKKELIDFSMDNEISKENEKHSWSFLLTCEFPKETFEEGDRDKIDYLDPKTITNITQFIFNKNQTPSTETADSFAFDPAFIDGISINEKNTNWANTAFTQTKNCIYKNTFELDPAKQAFNGLHSKDSSRVRWANVNTDYQYLILNKDIIEFPHTNIVKKVSDYTPKASFEYKNVCTDKTKFDLEKPNMTTVSFGMDAFRTRCFNWLSAGNFDEYVFIKDESNNTWKAFESYKQRDNDDLYDLYNQNKLDNSNYPLRKEFPHDICNIAYCGFRGKTDTIKIGKRVSSIFPASEIYYTSHKCIIDILSDNELTELNTPKTYIYVVGRADKTGKAPDFDHCSKEMHFTMYPNNYVPRIYHITDQQGFHWIEYQAWTAAAKALNEKIYSDCDNQELIPVLVNTGDMTQSGARINEWLDYYNAGEMLFDHLEQMNVVGNNDLCGTDVTKLGTGDDPGKSNGYFYYICYCYDIPSVREIPESGDDKTIAPIVNNTIIPSLYYFDFNCQSTNYRMCMVNSEITLTNCKDWFGLGLENNQTVNIYTGFNVTNSKPSAGSQFTQAYMADTKEFIPIYTMLYYMLKCNVNDDPTKYLVFCHEMPFTVITHANIASEYCDIARSINGSVIDGSLVGSKLNQLVAYENENNGYTKGTYWFTRLLEYKGVKLCIGGHKHTYCITYPLREYYKYDNNTKNSLDNGPMNMSSTLENDNISYIWKDEKWYSETPESTPIDLTNGKGVDHTKFPITYTDDETKYTTNKTILYPYTRASVGSAFNDRAVVYFMCQATGYKLTSNKELPTAQQKFTRILPETNNVTEKPNANQKYPMFAIYELTKDSETHKDIVKMKLGRFHNILNDSDHTFTQLSYGTGNISIKYMKEKDRLQNFNNYGSWVSDESYVFEPVKL